MNISLKTHPERKPESIDPGPCNPHPDFPGQCTAHQSHFINGSSVCAAAILKRKERHIPTCPKHPGVALIHGFDDNRVSPSICPECEKRQ